MPRPVILLAFANEQSAGGVYLRNLPQELRRLKSVLDRAGDVGLCEVEILSNATLSQIFDTFQKPKYRNRIAIFHYGGHADSFELLLEGESGASAAAHGSGLIPFLAGQQSLRLVFLNGCFSIRQAQALVDRGVPAVIGTVQAVDDEVATDLAGRFYQALAQGNTIERSWEEATYYLQAGKGSEDAAYYRKEVGGAGVTRGARYGQPHSRLPWEIHYRPGAEAVREWNLPEAAGNVLFGLPELPKTYQLPEEPFHFLKRYTKKEAPVFFGRGREIRSLYQRITNDLSSPVILLHGQSGVGKSSLLEAGLLPRLEEAFFCLHLRRDPEIGLLGQLERALGITDKGEEPAKDTMIAQRRLEEDVQQLEGVLAQLQGNARQQVEKNIQQYRDQLAAIRKEPPPPDLLAHWKRLEEQQGPLLVIVDQVEEVFTQPNAQLPNELEDFLHQVQQLFGRPEERPRGKLLLSYRQEYHAQIDKAMSDFGIHREETALFRLDKKGIMEVVNGLNASIALRNKYNTGIDPELPILIADDLLEDKHSPIAPVLQIILTKLWQKQKGETLKKFRQEDYQQLKRDGILLQDFFDQQMAAIRTWEQEIQTQVESSGLALDILNFHVTALVTADTRELDNLRRLYDHRAEVLDRLLHKFQSLYLLTGLNERQTRLAHDTLAPIVQHRMRVSDYPGQRALRILESKMTDYLLSPQTIYIDEEDLKIVESGAQGMRRWLPKERELIEKSRKRRAALEAERKRNRRFRQLAVAVVALLAVVATIFWRASEKGKRLAEANVLYNEGLLLSSTDPTAGLALIEEALQSTPDDDTKRKGYAELYARQMFYEVIHRSVDGFLNGAAVSADGRYLATTLDVDNEIRLYNLATGVELNRLQGANSPVYTLAFASDERLLAGSEDRNAYSWQLPAASRQGFISAPDTEGASVRSLATSPDGRWLLTGHADNFARLWNISSGQLEREFVTGSEVQAVVFHPNGEEVFLGVEDGVYHFSRTGEQLQCWRCTNPPLTALAIAPDAKTILTGHENGEVLRWNVSPEGYIRTDSTEAHSGEVTVLSFSVDGRYWFSASRDHTVKVWAADSGKNLYTLLGHTAPVHSLAVLKDQSALVTAAEDSTVRRWDFPHPLPWRAMETSGFQLTDLCWTPDGRYLLAASIDRKVYVFDTENYERVRVYAGHGAGVRSLAVSADGQRVASGDRKGDVHVWTLETAELIRQAELHGDAVNDLAFGNDSGRLASVGDDAQIVVWNWQGEQLDTIHLAGHSYEVKAVDLSPDGRRLLSTGLDTLAILWDIDARQVLDTFRLNTEGLQVAFINGTSEWLALGGDGFIRRFERGKQTGRLPGSGSLGLPEANGFYLTLGDRGCAPVIRSKSGFEIQRFIVPHDLGECVDGPVALSPSGKWIAAGAREGRVLIWNNRRFLEASPNWMK